MTSIRVSVVQQLKKDPHPIMKILANITRFDILKTLEHKDKSYTEICRDVSVGKTDSGIAFHLKILTEFHLIIKIPQRGLYTITVKGLNALRGVKIVNESEMFI